MPTTEDNRTLVQRAGDVQSLRNSAANMAMQGSQLEASANTFNDDIMSAVRADRQSRGVSNIATQVGATMGQLASDPEAIRARTSGMVDPTSVNALTAGSRAFNLQTLGEQATQQEYNQGSLDKIIQAGANQLLARAEQMKAQAAQEEAKANSLMESLQFEQSEKKRAFDEWAETERLKQSGSSSGGIDITGSLDSMEAPTEEEPNYSPAKGDGSISPGGEWIFKGGKWVSNQTSPKNNETALKLLASQAAAKGDIGTAASILSKLSTDKESAALTKQYRSEFNKQLNTNLQFGQVSAAYNRVQSLGGNPTNASDTALLYAYIKLLDPATGVKEGELATFQNIGSMPQQVQGAFNKVVRGKGTMSSQTRKDIVDSVNKLWTGYTNQVQQLKDQYTNMATYKGINPYEVIGELGSYTYPSGGSSRYEIVK